MATLYEGRCLLVGSAGAHSGVRGGVALQGDARNVQPDAGSPRYRLVLRKGRSGPGYRAMIYVDEGGGYREGWAQHGARSPTASLMLASAPWRTRNRIKAILLVVLANLPCNPRQPLEISLLADASGGWLRAYRPAIALRGTRSTSYVSSLQVAT